MEIIKQLKYFFLFFYFLNYSIFKSLWISLVLKGFKISFPEFFDENGNLLDSVSYDATTKNCKVSQSDCYNLMKTYLENDTDGAKIMQEIGETLHENARKDIELQQSLVRNRLCQSMNFCSDRTKRKFDLKFKLYIFHNK